MAHLDDIVFEKRNKCYGAYWLRRSYITHICIGTWGGVIIFVLLLMYAGAVSSFEREERVISKKPKSVVYTLLPPPPPVNLKARKLSSPKPPATVQSTHKSPASRTKIVKPALLPATVSRGEEAKLPLSAILKKANKKGASRKLTRKTALDKPDASSSNVTVAVQLPEGKHDSKLATLTISLHLKNVTLRRVLREIERQTDITFVYSRNYINVFSKVTVDVDNKNVIELLETLLTPRVIGYKLEEDNFIILFARR